MHYAWEVSSGGAFKQRRVLTFLCASLLFATCAYAQLVPSDVLILVNENSPTSRYIARLYRQYYPEIPESRVLCLSGLPDCSGPSAAPAEEIITRDQYDQCIAEPVRTYLIDNALVNEIKVIITTAGLPYRIEDSSYDYIVNPAASSPYAASAIGYVDAASVESELTVLFQNDQAGDIYHLLPLYDRAVNTYQAYRNSGIELFDRDILTNHEFMKWQYPRKTSYGHYPPIMEGEILTRYGVAERHFSAGDIYLVCRLDGPKNQGKSAVFAVRQMLERAKRASNPAIGVNPALAVAVLDDAPGAGNHDYNRVYNIDYHLDYAEYDPNTPQPPDIQLINTSDDYQNAFLQMTGQLPTPDVLNAGTMSAASDLTVICDERPDHLTNQDDLEPDKLLVVLAGFGKNGDEGSPKDYLTTQGPQSGPLFQLTNGAVFTSVESYNAVTMFSDATTSQAKLIDFIQIGGAGAIGHSFEPYDDAAIDNEFLFYNLLADADGDGKADLTFAEAAFTAIPYLSWAEVAIGDPLMQIAYGPGQKTWTQLYGDADNNGIVNYSDIWQVYGRLGGRLNTTNATAFELYSDLGDVNKDGIINYGDIWLVNGNIGARADW